MKTIYEASNSIEAHMIKHLLELEDISTQINGEYLQGGIGELQASGLVRVLVDENDYIKAKDIIGLWEQKQPKEEKTKPVTIKDTLLSGVVGFIMGSILILFLYNTPATTEEIDNNNDGLIDGWYVYVNDRLSKVKSDRNFDGEVDHIYYYDRHEKVTSMRADNDFNGTLESIAIFKNGNPISSSTDSNGDGFKDYREIYKDGIIETTELFDLKTKMPVKITKYKLNKQISSKFDSNHDGILDIEYHYDRFEEIKEKRKI